VIGQALFCNPLHYPQSGEPEFSNSEPYYTGLLHFAIPLTTSKFEDSTSNGSIDYFIECDKLWWIVKHKFLPNTKNNDKEEITMKKDVLLSAKSGTTTTTE